MIRIPVYSDHFSQNLLLSSQITITICCISFLLLYCGEGLNTEYWLRLYLSRFKHLYSFRLSLRIRTKSAIRLIDSLFQLSTTIRFDKRNSTLNLLQRIAIFCNSYNRIPQNYQINSNDMYGEINIYFRFEANLLVNDMVIS